MTAVLSSAAAPSGILDELHAIGAQLKNSSPADTVACAYGIGSDVLAWYDESDGRYFDLASLTKPLFTAPTVLGLVAESADLDRPSSEVLDWLPPGAPSLRRLLTHAAGLPDEFPADVAAADVLTWLANRVGEIPADHDRVSYSDPSYWMLGRWAAARSGTALHSLFENAPTARAGEFLFGGAPADRTVTTGGVDGAVQLTHDPSARRFGESGHAGAFGTLAGVIDAVEVWLDPSWLTPDLATDAVSCQTHATPGGHRSLAWTLAGDPYHVVAHDWPPTTVSHSGFTGVSVALDPVSRWWAVYLSNAIPVEHDALPILRARRRFHAVAATDLATRPAHDQNRRSTP